MSFPTSDLSFESSTIHSYSVPSGPMGHHDGMSAWAVHDALVPQGDHDALAPQGDCDASAPQGDPDAVEHSHVYKDLSTYQTPVVSHQHISEYTRSHITPAPQPLITVDDLTTLSRGTRRRTHHWSRETISLSNKHISSPLHDDPSIYLLQTQTAFQLSISLILYLLHNLQVFLLLIQFLTPMMLSSYEWGCMWFWLNWIHLAPRWTALTEWACQQPLLTANVRIYIYITTHCPLGMHICIFLFFFTFIWMSINLLQHMMPNW
jgi:hypothetical protein